MPLKDKEKRAEYQRAYHAANREKLLADMRERSKKPEYVAKRVAYAKENPDVIRRLVKAWRKRNPEKRRAWWTYTNALRAGKLVKPEVCPKCGGTGLIDGHHADYNKPLDVEFLCRACHMKQHQRDNTHEQ